MPEHPGLRLETSALEALVQKARGERAGAVPALAEVELADGRGELTEVGRLVGETLAAGVWALELDIATNSWSTTVSGCLSDTAAVLVHPAGTGAVDVALCAPSFLAARVADLVALGPRPRLGPPGGLVIPERCLGAITAARDARAVRRALGDAAAGVPLDWIERLAGFSRIWRLTLTGDAGDRVHCGMVDCEERGCWLLADAPADRADSVVIVSATSTAVWRVLTATIADVGEAALRAPRTAGGVNA